MIRHFYNKTRYNLILQKYHLVGTITSPFMENRCIERRLLIKSLSSSTLPENPTRRLSIVYMTFRSRYLHCTRLHVDYIYVIYIRII